MWVLFLVYLPFKRGFSNFWAITALLLGMIKRHGTPSMTPEYLS
jgi:hypothetical protein